MSTVKSDILLASQQITTRTLTMAVISLQVLNLMIIFLTIYYCQTYGFGFSPNKENAYLNWHQLLMTVSFLFIVSNASLVYRLCYAFMDYKTARTIHMLLTVVAVLISIPGIFQIYIFHRQTVIPDLMTTHAVIGLLTEFLTILQLLSGNYAFLFPGVIDAMKLYKPFHTYFGILVLLLMIATVVSGLTLRGNMSMKRVQKTLLDSQMYHNLPNEAYVLNAIGVAVVLQATLVMFIVAQNDFQPKAKRF